MADASIFDLTQETVMTAAARLILQETSGATRATSATFALLGGLVVSNETVTTTDVTGVVGTLHVCTIAGLTASRNLTLPSAQVGERVGVQIVDGDASFELILKGAASQTINGGSAATEWSRLFIQGECVIFRCVAANTWIVEIDGRIPSLSKLKPQTQITTNSAATWTDCDFASATVSHNTGDLHDIANDHFNIRRTNFYTLGIAGRPVTYPTTTQYYGLAYHTVTGSSITEQRTWNRTSTATAHYYEAEFSRSATVGDEIFFKFRSQVANNGFDAPVDSLTWFIVQEHL